MFLLFFLAPITCFPNNLVPFSNPQVLPQRSFGILPLRYKSDLTNDDDRFHLQPHGDEIHNDDHLLSNPRSIAFPMTINLGREYTVTRFVAQGADAAVYEGYYQDGDDRKEAIFKVYTGGVFFTYAGHNAVEYFNNEKNALSKLQRLIDVDEENMILVMPKISGTSLGEIVRKLRTNMTPDDDETQQILKSLMKRYLKLAQEFREKWGMIHLDVHPVNVMVDDEGEMHLIDFAKTQEKKGSVTEIRLKSNLDDLYAKMGAAIHFGIPVEELELEV